MVTSKKIIRKKLAPAVREPVVATDYPDLLAEVKARIQSAQYAALCAVSKELVGLYWDIGRLIVERQKDAKHDAAIAERLADDLRDAFLDVGGFSRRNVFYRRVVGGALTPQLPVTSRPIRAPRVKNIS